MVSCPLLSIHLCPFNSINGLRPHLKRRDYRDKDGVAQGNRHEPLEHEHPQKGRQLSEQALLERLNHAKVAAHRHTHDHSGLCRLSRSPLRLV